MMPNNPFLSIVVIFCDKDYQFIESLCKEINKNVKLSHEIILIDNREVYKDKFINLPGNVFMHSVGYNAYQFEGRRLAVQFCSGKYVWYVDADDEVLIVEDYWKDAISNEDVALFSAMMTDLSFKLNKSFFIRKALLNNSIYLSRDWHELELKNVWNFFGCCLWDKWIKRTVLEEVIKLIPKNKVIVASEDKFYISLVMKNSCKVFITNHLIYNYKIKNSTCAKNIMSYESFCHIIKGYKEVEKLFNKYINDPLWQDKGFDFNFFLSKIPNTDRPKDSLKEIVNNFGLNYVKDNFYNFLKSVPEDSRKVFDKILDEVLQ